MLTPADDLPIHQTAAPIAHPASGDPNHYDRYFFNGFDSDGSTFFALAMGVYPNRGVIDGAFSVVVDGVQRSVWASGPASIDRLDTRVGPLQVSVVEPLRTLRIDVDAPDHGLAASLTFSARTPPVEEPRATFTHRGRIAADFTRLTQWGRWTGTYEVDGTVITCDPDRALGVRDRSWGVRTVGTGAAPSPDQQAYWLWIPVHLEDRCGHVALLDAPDGRHLYESAMVVPDLSDDVPLFGADDPAQHLRSVDVQLTWQPGTRWASGARVAVRPWHGDPVDLVLRPILRFQMAGLGYHHPRWAHGVDHGRLAVEGATWPLDDVDPLQPENAHVQSVCTVEMGDQTGVGILEHRIWGPHRPSGFVDFMGPSVG